MYPERRLAPFEPGPEGRAFGVGNKKSPAPALMSEKATACDAEQQRACGKCKGVRVWGCASKRSSTSSRNASGVCTCSSKTCATKTTEIDRAPRARERLNRSSAYGDLLTTGRSREEVGYTSLPKDKNTATESSLRRRGRALNLAGLLSAKQGRKRTTGR